MREQDDRYLADVQPSSAWINIHGCRTMGKSSLVVQHLHDLTKFGKLGIPVDIASAVGDKAKTGLAWVGLLANAIAARIGCDSQRFHGLLTQFPVDTPAGPALQHLLEYGLLAERPEAVVLILDEYDSISGLEYRDEILFALRHVQAAQVQSDTLKRLSICLVGWRPITDLGTPGAANTSPIASTIEMTDFDVTDATIESLQRGFSTEACPTKDVFRRVLELSGGQPFVTMELLRALEQRHAQTIDDVNRISLLMVEPSGLGRDSALFGSIEKNFRAAGSAAFAALSKYDALLRGSAEARSEADAELLLLHGLVRRREGSLEIKGELFRRRFDEAWTNRMLQFVASRTEQYRGKSGGTRKKICIINSGGTLGMVQRGDKVEAPKDESEFRANFRSLDEIADVTFLNLFDPRDSINIFPDQWVAIAKQIYALRNGGFDGFVIAHGTDTMAYTASAVAFALGRHLRFPVVFTGAQTTPDVPFGDAHVNLYRACEVAKQPIPEVVISFGNFVYRAVRAQKRDDRRFDGFESPTYPPLAEITGEINVRTELLRHLPRKKVDIELRANFETSVLIVQQFPGLEPEFFDGLLQSEATPACRGIIVQTLGAGNVASVDPYSFIPFIRRAYASGIPVIITSQYPPDPGSHTRYHPAQAPLDAGAIHAGNMTLAAAVAKFRWILADVLHRKEWQQLKPSQKKALVADSMVKRALIGEF